MNGNFNIVNSFHSLIRYCTKELREQDGKYYYKNISLSHKTVMMYFALSERKDIYKIHVRKSREDEETQYVGWLDKEGNISLIFPNKIMLEVCFPYGTNVEEKAGKGKVIRIFVEEIGII